MSRWQSTFCSSDKKNSPSTLWMNTSKKIFGLNLFALTTVSCSFGRASVYGSSWASRTKTKARQLRNIDSPSAVDRRTAHCPRTGSHPENPDLELHKRVISHILDIKSVCRFEKESREETFCRTQLLEWMICPNA